MLYTAGSAQDISVEAAELCGLTWQGGCLWFADSAAERVVALDPVSGSVARTIDCPQINSDLAVQQGSLLYASDRTSQLFMIDPDSGVLMACRDNPRVGRPIGGIEGSRGGLWLGYGDTIELRSMPDLSLVTCIGVTGIIHGLTVTDRYVIYSDRLAEEITIVNPVIEREVLSVNVHGAPTGLAWDGRRIWYCDAASARLRAVDMPGIVASY